MADVYLAKSELTGAVYAIHGKSKTNVTEFVTDLIKIETDRERADRDYVLGLLRNLAEAVKVEYADPSNEDRYMTIQLETALAKAEEITR